MLMEKLCDMMVCSKVEMHINHDILEFRVWSWHSFALSALRDPVSIMGDQNNSLCSHLRHLV